MITKRKHDKNPLISTSPSLAQSDSIRFIYLNFYLFDEDSLKTLAKYVYDIYKKDKDNSDIYTILILYQSKEAIQEQSYTANTPDFQIDKNKDISSFWLRCNKKDRRTSIEVQINKSFLFPSDSKIRISSSDQEHTLGIQTKIGEIIENNAAKEKKKWYTSIFISYGLFVTKQIFAIVFTLYFINLLKVALSLDLANQIYGFVFTYFIMLKIAEDAAAVLSRLILSLFPNIEIYKVKPAKSKFIDSTFVKAIIFVVLWIILPFCATKLLDILLPLLSLGIKKII